MKKLQIRLIETDSLDEGNNYYLYEVETDTEHYYIARSDEDIKNTDSDTLDYSNKYTMKSKSDFTDRELEIAKYLFNFLWDSSNGTNTEVEKDIYEEDGFEEEEIMNFVDKFNKEQPNDVLDAYEDGGVEIYWDYFSCFDMNSFSPWEKTYTVQVITTFRKEYQVKADSPEQAKKIVEEDLDDATDTDDIDTEIEVYH